MLCVGNYLIQEYFSVIHKHLDFKKILKKIIISFMIIIIKSKIIKLRNNSILICKYLLKMIKIKNKIR